MDPMLSNSLSSHTGIEDRQATGPDEIRSKNLVVRLARDDAEISAAQALRYRVFYEEMQARPTDEMKARGKDFDAFDEFADHLLVLDESLGQGSAGVVGTYRLLRRTAAAKCGGFYTASEYEIDKLTALDGEILELGRSCVDADYRERRVINLLWQGIAAYLAHYEIVVMFGCASLPGDDVEALKLPLAYLYHHHLAPPELRTRAVADRYVDMNLLPEEEIDQRKALASVPPLIKGYLRLGGFVGDGAVVDEQFNTTDVCVVVKTDLITKKYVRHYGRRSPDLQSD